MKKILYSLKTGMAVLLISLTACQDLTEEPVGFVSPETFYKTVAQGEAALVASMNELWDYWAGYSWGSRFFLHDDQLLGGDFNITPGFANEVWDMHYRAINNINGVIRAVKGGSISGAEQEDVDALVGQAKFLR